MVAVAILMRTNIRLISNQLDLQSKLIAFLIFIFETYYEPVLRINKDSC